MFFTFDLCLLLYVIRLAGWLKHCNLSLSQVTHQHPALQRYSPGLLNILATSTPFPICFTKLTYLLQHTSRHTFDVMHKIAFLLSALVLSVNACYYSPGPVNTCIITEFGCRLLSTCQTLANTTTPRSLTNSSTTTKYATWLWLSHARTPQKIFLST